MSRTKRPVAGIVETRVSITVDGKSVDVVQGETLLAACNAAGVDTPTIC